MWHRLALTATAVLLGGATAQAQINNVYSRALPPDKATMDRLNLKIEWTANIPVEGRRDTLTQVQTFGDQIFVQTRTGLLIAGDALTGQLQWFKQLGNGDFANTYPVAVNSEYVFVAHVTKLHAFHRYTGVVEFMTDMGSPPTNGLAADESGVYCVLGMRPGSSGGHRIAVFNLPRPIAIAGVGKTEDPNKPAPKDPRAVNPVDNLMSRYAPENLYRTTLPDTFDAPRNRGAAEVPVGGLSSSRSPSLSALPRVTPPYTLDNENSTPSVGLVPSLRQPYRLRTDYQKDIQRTPSLGTLPPSVAAALALTDLRPRNVEAPLRWEYGMSSRIIYPLFLTPTRVWAVTDSQTVIALSKRDKTVEVVQKLADPIGSFPGRAGTVAYLTLGSGYALAIEGTQGTPDGGANVHWRTAIGGIANRTPFVTDKFVYAGGDNSGVVCMHRLDGPLKARDPSNPERLTPEYHAGEVVWRSSETADRVIGANEEFVYIRDRQGKLLVFDAKRATNPATQRSAPLGGTDLAEFNINIVNTVSDRIYLAADNGLIVCLRDANPKYARPVRITPEATVNAVAKDRPGQPKKDGDPKKDPEPKAEPEAKKN